eukprot:gene22844-29018_t
MPPFDAEERKMYTLEAICISARKLGVKSYPGIIEKVSGLSLRIVFAFILLFLVFAVIVGFLILLRQIGGDLAQFIIMASGHDPFTVTHLCPMYVELIGVVLSFPLMLTTNLFRLRYACYVSCAMILFLLLNLSAVLYIQMQVVDSHMVTSSIKYLPSSLYDVLESIPLIAILFTPHFNMMDVFEQLREPTPHRTFVTIATAVTTLTFFFLSLGFVGYFLTLTQPMMSMAPDNILQLLPGADMMLFPARLALFIAIICSLPVYMVPCREFIHGLHSHLREALARCCGCGGGGSGEGERTERGYSQWEEYALLEKNENKTKKSGARSSAEEDGHGAGKYYQRDGETTNSNANKHMTPTQREQYERQQLYQKNHDNINSNNAQSVCRANWHVVNEFFLTLVVVILAILTAQSIPDRVSLVWRVAGSLAVLPVTVFIPALFYLLLGRELHTQKDRYTVVSYIIVCLSAPLILLTGGWNIYSLAK